MGKRGSGGEQDGVLQTSWACSSCGSQNWSSRQACRCCGGRKTFAQVVKSKSGNTTPAAKRTAGPAASIKASVTAPAAKNDFDVQMESPRAEGAHTATREEALEKVKNLEFLVQSVGSHSPVLKEDLAMNLELARKELRATKPLGARLDALKGAISRNEQKLEEADAAVAVALANKESVESKLMDLRSARSAVELALAGAGLAEEATDAAMTAPVVDMLMQQMAAMQRQQGLQILQIAAFMKSITANSADKQQEIQKFAVGLEDSIPTPVPAAPLPAVAAPALAEAEEVPVPHPASSVTEAATEPPAAPGTPGRPVQGRVASSPPAANRRRQTDLAEHGFTPY
jgi:hypothetical protein